MKLEDVSCPICVSSQSDRLMECPALRLTSTDLRFTLRRCRQCGLVFTSPRPDAAEMDLLYGNQYFPSKSSPWAAFINRAAVHERTTFIRKHVPRGSILDIGCGLGGFLMDLPADKFDGYGLEPYHGLFASVPERIRSRIKFESFDRASFPESSFDLVTLWHVLEHMPEPVACLKKTYSLVKPGGCLILEVPNLASVEARWLAHNWYHLDVPYHFWHFTPQTFRTIIAKAGFEIQSLQTITITRPILLLNYLFLGANSIQRWARERIPILKRRDWLDRGFRFLGLPMCVLERFGLFFSTPTMRVVAVKKP